MTRHDGPVTGPTKPGTPVRVQEGQAASERAAEVLARYFSELDSRLPGGFNPALTEVTSPEDVTPPKGDFLLMTALNSDEVIACGAVRLVDADTAELRRLWVAPDARGRGFGRTLLRNLENRARGLGARRVVCSLNPEMVEGLELFTRRGYTPTEPFWKQTTASIFLGKDLA